MGTRLSSAEIAVEDREHKDRVSSGTEKKALQKKRVDAEML